MVAAPLHQAPLRHRLVQQQRPSCGSHRHVSTALRTTAAPAAPAGRLLCRVYDDDHHGPPQDGLCADHPKPAIILMEPQMGENIGSVARAMKNFGLSDLRLVSPRDGWPNPSADATASHAVDVLRGATLHGSLESALADLNYVYAATARSRFMHKAVITAHELPSDVRARPGQRLGILMGRENSGLTNEEVALANKIVTIDAHPDYPVLNLAQAAVVVCYELWQQQQLLAIEAGGGSMGGGARPLAMDLATRGQVEAIFTRLEESLERVDFFESPEKKPATLLSIRSLLARVESLSGQEVQLMHGMLSKLAAARRPGAGSGRSSDSE